MDIYSTLSHEKENLVPINENRINMFVCGPTVYDDAHIGHGRTYVAFDTIKRFLEYLGYSVFIFRILLMLMIRLSTVQKKLEFLQLI